MKFSDKRYGFLQANNLKYSNHSKLIFLLLFPFFEIKTSWHYADSALYSFISCGKDVFYRLLTDARIDRRNLWYDLNMQLIRKVQNQSKSDNTVPRCLVIDDTDLHKTGRRISPTNHYTPNRLSFFRDDKNGKYMIRSIWKKLTAKEIVDLLRRKKKVVCFKLLGFYRAEIIVDFKGIPVKLFFLKVSKKGNWKGILTINTNLAFEEAYKIYSIRRSVEVFFKESKQYLGLEKC